MAVVSAGLAGREGWDEDRGEEVMVRVVWISWFADGEGEEEGRGEEVMVGAVLCC